MRLAYFAISKRHFIVYHESEWETSTRAAVHAGRGAKAARRPTAPAYSLCFLFWPSFGPRLRSYEHRINSDVLDRPTTRAAVVDGAPALDPDIHSLLQSEISSRNRNRFDVHQSARSFDKHSARRQDTTVRVRTARGQRAERPHLFYLMGTNDWNYVLLSVQAPCLGNKSQNGASHDVGLSSSEGVYARCVAANRVVACAAGVASPLAARSAAGA
ncbi:hypothetical protein EVAR_31801_1 [Eumeta japonica]|uniref:Uncharacterized protein n=1 Tax=Eumeta variegata TaxID=151549 RepID=A0A4C1W6U9_EUMVA|nr:hypothetical protein EVAR_31801_1 [Eumeta japonica]